MEKVYNDFSMDRYRQAERMLNQLIAVGLYDADEVEEAIAPFVLDYEKGITVISILKHIRTPLSEKHYSMH